MKKITLGFLIGFLTNSVIHNAHVYNVSILALMLLALVVSEYADDFKESNKS